MTGETSYPYTPVEAEERHMAARRKITIVLVLGVVLLGGFLFFQSYYASNQPVTYVAIEDHFKYGSIGSDRSSSGDYVESGLPLRVIQVLPRAFPQYLPPDSPHDYTAFGFIQEQGKTMPIGFSTRRQTIDLTGLNCAACHAGVVRASPQSPPKVYLGMPSNTVDLQAFFEFLFKCAGDRKFNVEYLLPQMEREGRLLPTDRLIYKTVIPQLQVGLLKRQAQLREFIDLEHPRFGPGRVDTFNPYKANQLASDYPEGIPLKERYGTADFPSIWDQKDREGLQLHWDGNNDSVQERNLSAAFGAGATPKNIDRDSIKRVNDWIATLPAPIYPFSINHPLAQKGEEIYNANCANCHDFHVGGGRVGKVVDLEQIGTDEHRLNSYTDKLRTIQKKYWNFQHFSKTNGYANTPLDGIWARAPYLHNGSVPNMWELLTPQEKRGAGQNWFYTGHGVYDQKRLGFRTDVSEVAGHKSFKFVTTEIGNSNKGHSGKAYGTQLSDEDKWSLIEYLKTK